MWLIPLLTVLTWQLQPEVPFKPSEEFKVELEYTFKTKPLSTSSYIDLAETEAERQKRLSGGGMLPFLAIRLSFLHLSDKEVRVKCTDNNKKNILARKVEVNREYSIELGFTDDVKDRVTAHQYTIVLLSADKDEVSRIVLFVDRDGTFLVNGMKRGRF